MIKYFFTRQFLGFVAVGGMAALLHWLSRILLSIWLPFAWAVALAYTVGIIVAFALNRIFIFPNSKKPMSKQAREFFLINILFFPLVWIASISFNYFLRKMGIITYSQAIAHGAAVALPMFATFLIYKFIAFKEVIHGEQ